MSRLRQARASKRAMLKVSHDQKNQNLGEIKNRNSGLDSFEETIPKKPKINNEEISFNVRQ